MSGALAGYLLTGPSLWEGSWLPSAYADIGPKTGTNKTTICCFCGVGCGAIVCASGGKVVAVEGDPDHPINQGTLCSKGQAQYQTCNQLVSDAVLASSYSVGKKFAKWPKGKRLARPLYRAAGSNKWEVKTWDWMLTQIAARIDGTRSTYWEYDSPPASGKIVNRTQAIAALGGAVHDNEECFLMQKLWRGLGLVNIDHQARI
jgi:formate dehydrogenase major subunit